MDDDANGRIYEIAKGSSADQQGIKANDHIFSINKKDVLGEGNEILESLLQDSADSVEIGVLKPKKFDAQLCKHSICLIDFVISRNNKGSF